MNTEFEFMKLQKKKKKSFFYILFCYTFNEFGNPPLLFFRL